MGLRALLYLYGRRLRAYPVQELLAGLGIAIGVALAFAVMVANGSVVAAAGEALRGVTGSADLQLTSPDGRPFDARALRTARQVPGVARAAPLLEQRAVLVGPRGRRVSVTLASLDASIAGLSGGLTRSFAPGGFQLAGGVMIPKGTASELGLPTPSDVAPSGRLPTVTVNVRGRVHEETVPAILGRDTIGPLDEAKLAVAPLARLQRLTGLQGRITRILVESEPGRSDDVREALSGVAPGRLSVSPADTDIRLLRRATGPTEQVTGFFAAVSALLGFLLAFNAMLLTAPERRRLVGALRIQGYRPSQVVLLVLFQAALLGIVASAFGVAVGSFLARGLFSESPDYLASGFTLGGSTMIGNVPLILAVGGGILASCLAAAPPLLDLRRNRAVDAVFHERGSPGNAVTSRSRQQMLLGSFVLLLVATVLLVWWPEMALVASGLLAVATLLLIPTTFALLLALLGSIARRAPRASTLTVALLAMRATTLRSLALAATGAVAVFGSVAIGGARDDLLRGLGDYASDYVGTADIWVLNPADNQGTNDIRPGTDVRRIAAVPGVKAVRRYQGGFLDFGGQRIWVIARPPGDSPMLPPSQLVSGDLALASSRLRQGGWVAVSDQLAKDREISPGDRIALTTPTGRVQYRLAATTTNLGWAPGAITLNSRDYRRAWATDAPTAFEVDALPGADVGQLQSRIVRDLGPTSGLVVQSAGQHAAQMNASAQQGLRRLGQISMLLLVAAVLAMAAAMGAAIWQRRAALAALRLQSFSPRQLWLLLLLEAAAVLGAGGLTGALVGVCGQLGADRYLAVVTGFPVSPVPAGWTTIWTFALVVPTALLIVAIPGWFASRVSPRLGLGSD